MQDTLMKTLKILAIIALVIVICYTLLQVGAYFMDLVTITGISIVLTYVLLGPVNSLDSFLKKAGSFLSQRLGEAKKTDGSDHPLKVLLKVAPFFQSRVMSIFVVYILFIAVMVFIAFQIIPSALYQVSDLAHSIPSYAEQAINEINEKFPEIEIPGLSKDLTAQLVHKQTFLPIIVHELTPEFRINFNADDEDQYQTQSIEIEPETPKKISKEQFKNIITATAMKFQNSISDFLKTHAQNAINNLLGLLAGTITGIGYTVTVIVLSFYFLLDGKQLVKWFNTLIPTDKLKRFSTLQESIHNSLLGFLRGQVYLGIATGAFMLVIYTVFDVKFSVFLSLFLAIAEIIPVIGSSLGFIPAIIVMLFTDPMQIPFVWAIFFVFQIIKDNIIAPKVVGEIIGLHPVTVIFALWIGYQVAGFFGILFAIPVASVLNVILNFIITERSHNQQNISEV